MVKMRYAHAVHMLKEGDAKLPVEHPAEVFPVQAELIRYFGKRKMFIVMLLDVIQYILYPLAVTSYFRSITRFERDRKMTHEQIKYLQYN